MEHGDDYVAARLSIEIPSEGLSGVREITEGVDRFRTAMEAATRAEADMTRYVTEMGEATRKASEYHSNLVDQMTKIISLQPHLQGGGSYFPGVPGGAYQQPFEGQTHGVGPITPGSRPPSPSDVVYQLQGAASGGAAGQHGLINMAASRGVAGPMVNLSPDSVGQLANSIAEREHAGRVQDHETGSGKNPRGGSGTGEGGGGRKPVDPFDQAEKRIQQGSNVAGSVLNEIGAPQGVGFARLGAAGLDAMRKRFASKGAGDKGEGGENSESEDADGGSGGLSGIAKGLGIFGSLLTAGAAIYDTVQSGGQMVQGWRNMAEARGGAGGEGAQLALKAREDASSPYVTTDQARQVNQALVTEGYSDSSGNAMGQNGQAAHDFMMRNLTDNNMTVAQSVQMLRLAADGTKISITELSNNLNALKEVSKNGGPLSQSLDDMRQEMVSRASSLSAQGVSPEAALQQGFNSAIAFNGDPELQGTMSSMVPTATGTMMQRLHGGPGGGPLPNIPPGLTPDEMQRYIDNNYPDQSPMYQDLAQKAKYFKKVGRDQNGKDDTPTNPNGRDRALGLFKHYIQQAYPSSDVAKDEQKIIALYMKFAWEGVTPQQVVDDNKRTKDDATLPQRQVGDRGSGYGGAPTSGGTGGRGPATYGSGAIDNMLQAYGGNEKNIEVLDTDGGVTSLDVTNKKQMEDLADGKLKWRHKGDKGRGITIEDTPGGINKDFSTDDPSNPNGMGGDGTNPDNKNGTSGKAGVSGTVTIDLSDQAKQLFKLGQNPVPLTPNGMAANSGQGQAQKNNPPAGDAPVTRWGGWK